VWACDVVEAFSVRISKARVGTIFEIYPGFTREALTFLPNPKRNNRPHMDFQLYCFETGETPVNRCRFWTRFIAPATFVLVLSAPCNAQTDLCRDHIAVVSVAQIRLNHSPVPITNLSAEDFRVSARGKPLVRTAKFHAQPAKVVLLVDVGENPKADWKSQLVIAGELVAALSPDVELDLITFSNQVGQKFSFQKDRQSFLAALSQLAHPGNRSSEKGLLAAVNEGFAALNPPHAGDAEIFLSAAPLAGDREKHERQRLEQLLSPSGVRLFGVAFAEPNFTFNGQRGFGVPVQPSHVDEHSEFYSSSELLAYDTGGMVFPFLGTSSKPPIKRPEAEFLASVISTFYLLDLDVSQPTQKTEQLQIELKNKKLAEPGLLWHSTHLFPCP
jgi:hypothetical protein